MPELHELKISDQVQVEKLSTAFPRYFKNHPIDPSQLLRSYLLIEDGQTIYGFLQYTLLYDRMELEQIYVDEAYRNRQVASHLLNRLLQIASHKQVHNITLEVSVENKIAIHLYQKYGFQTVAVRKGYYHGIDAWLMEKEVIK